MSVSSAIKVMLPATAILGITALTTGLVLESRKEEVKGAEEEKIEELKGPQTKTEKTIVVEKESEPVIKTIRIIDNYDRNKYKVIGPSTHIPRLTYERPEYKRPTGWEKKDEEFLLIRLGKPEKESTIEENMKIEDILTKIYQKKYTSNQQTMDKRIKENWSDLIKENETIRYQRNRNKAWEKLISECEKTKKNTINGDWFQVKLDFAVKYCLEDSDSIRGKTYSGY